MYDFRKLSPADFEELTRDLLQEEWGVRLEVFKTGRDGGIDLRYSEIPGASTIIQCKHYVGSTIQRLVSDLKRKERPKIERLAPSRYVLVTSLPLNPADKDKILANLHPFIKTTHDIFGGDDLNNLLGRHGCVEEHHFKLWMSSTTIMQHVLHNAIHVQTEFDVQRVLRNIPLYVQTSNYPRAEEVINEHRVVIISGPPGIGKTTLADMLLFAHLEAGYQPIIVNADIKEAKDLFRNNKPQVFYFDDFLGQTFLGNRFDFLGKREDAIILNFIEQVARSKHARFILTTREHILRHAMQISEHFRRRRSTLAQEKFIIELESYTLLDRARILYNHIYFSDLEKPYRSALLRDQFYLRIINHRNFNPRLIEWLTRFTNIKRIPAKRFQQEVWRILENPEELWRIAFEQQISEAARSVLLALYTFGGRADLNVLHETWKRLHEHRARKYNTTWSAQDWRQALADLDGGFLSYHEGNASFINPSLKDFLDATLATDHEHLQDVLATAREFTQVLTIWSLALSEKGAQLREYFRNDPHQLAATANQRLIDDYDQRLHWGHSHITKPEARLLTMISIADETQAEALYQAAVAYGQTLVSYWGRFAPDIKTAVTILRDLDHARWAKLKSSGLHTTIKDGILHSFTWHQRSADLTVAAEYSQGSNRWSAADQRRLRDVVRDYFESSFDAELSDAESEAELEELGSRVNTLGSACDVTTDRHSTRVEDALAEIRNRPEEEAEQPIKSWQREEQTAPQNTEEAEVRRLFDGLR